MLRSHLMCILELEMHVDTEVHSQLNLISGENTVNRPCVYGSSWL